MNKKRQYIIIISALLTFIGISCLVYIYNNPSIPEQSAEPTPTGINTENIDTGNSSNVSMKKNESQEEKIKEYTQIFPESDYNDKTMVVMDYIKSTPAQYKTTTFSDIHVIASDDYFTLIQLSADIRSEQTYTTSMLSLIKHGQEPIMIIHPGDTIDPNYIKRLGASDEIVKKCRSFLYDI